MKKITDKTLVAWLAGFVDGEGTISISRSNKKSAPHPYLRPIFQVANTDLSLLLRCREIILLVHPKANVRVVTSNRGIPGQKVGYRLALNNQRDLLILLPVLVPYLEGKKEQARIVLDFCSRRTNRVTGKKYQFKDLDWAEYWRCRELNRRGVSVESSGEPSAVSADEGVLRTVEGSTELAEMTSRLVN